jgi:hypothetical protein
VDAEGFLKTTFASRMAQETCNDSTETAWTYHEHRRLLDDKMMAVCRIYAEVELADLPVHEGERAQKWLMITHKNIERAREHIGMRIRDAGEWGAPPSLPEGRYSCRQRDRRWAVRATLQAEAAATRARLQAVRTGGMLGKPQPAAKADAEPRVKARGPTLLRDPECKVCTGGTSGTSIVSRAIAQGAEEEGDGEAGSEATVQGAGESSESDNDERGSGFRPVLRARADSSPTEVGDSDEETPTLGQSPGEGDEFARELANTMSAIANLVVKATGRSVSNGGWLYFSGT